MKSSFRKLILAGIVVIFLISLIVAAHYRDLVGDEAAYAFRAVGYLDYLGTNFQTQPIEWYADADLPWWSWVSFHDAPPLFFLVYHWFFRMFGDTVGVARFVSMLFGIGTLVGVYALVRRLWGSVSLALMVAGLFAINGAALWLFSSVLIEPMLVFLIVLSALAFFAYIDNPRRWWMVGATLGLIGLTKYTGIFIVPVFLLYLALRHRDRFRDWRLYAVVGIVLVMLTPVFIYNGYLFADRGHFDLQLAYLLGQETPEWQELVGKTENPFSAIGQNLVATFGWAHLIAAFIGLFLLYRSSERSESRTFIYVYLCVSIFIFIFVGSAPRFLSMLIPVFIMLEAYVVWRLLVSSSFSSVSSFPRKRESIVRIISIVIVTIIVGVEILFTVQLNIVRQHDYGIASLDAYFRNEFRGVISEAVPRTENLHLDAVIQKFAERDADGLPKRFAIIYDDAVAIPTLQWNFLRRFFYHATPTFFVENFIATVQQAGSPHGGFEGFDLYFVRPTPLTLLNPFKAEKEIGDQFESLLLAAGLVPEVIRGTDNAPMFRIFTFKIDDILQ